MSNEQTEGLRKRAQSVTRAEEIKDVEKKVRRKQPDKPCHQPRDSLFSWTSGFTQFTGFVNWGFLLLSIGGLRLFLENFIKYGIRIDPIQWLYILSGKDDEGAGHPSVVLILYSNVPIVFCILVEKGISVEIIPQAIGMFTHVANLLALIILPMVVIHVQDGFSFIGASLVSTLYSVLFLKLWSYVQVNLWCRTARQQHKSTLRRSSLSSNNLPDCGETNGKKQLQDKKTKDKENELVNYPDNLTLKDLYYFLFAPTLCYELNFPKTDRIRKRFLLKRIVEVILGFQLILCIIQQYMIPSVKNSLIPFSNLDYARSMERLLKLAMPNHLAWLCMFYILFHSWLNLLGEILHFADRSFYSDWWNSTNIDSFWRTWNLPVHRWCLRHLYLPMVEMGYNKNVAATTVFFLSAFFHEYLVSVPLKTYKIWAFMGMMGQIPLSSISRSIEKKYGPRCGNIVVWASLIIGQPLAIMMYYHDYIVDHYGKVLIEDFGRV